MAKQRRTCIACRECTGKGILVRVVLKEGRLLVDERQSMEGRGAYVHARFDCLKKVRTADRWARALRTEAGVIDSRSAQEVFEALMERASDEVRRVDGMTPSNEKRKLPRIRV